MYDQPSRIEDVRAVFCEVRGAYVRARDAVGYVPTPLAEQQRWFDSLAMNRSHAYFVDHWRPKYDEHVTAWLWLHGRTAKRPRWVDAPVKPVDNGPTWIDVWNAFLLVGPALPFRIAKAFAWAGIFTRADLKLVKASTLKAIPNLGKKSRAWLLEHGFIRKRQAK